MVLGWCQATMKGTTMITSLPNVDSLHSVRARELVEQLEKEQVGRRIWTLREDSEETNRSIADYCDVDPRTVGGWVAGDGISVKNMKKVAKMFGVSYEYVRYGHAPGQTPDPFPANGRESLEEAVLALNGKLDQVLANQAELLASVAQVRKTQLDRQSSRKPEQRKRGQSGK